VTLLYFDVLDSYIVLLTAFAVLMPQSANDI